MIILKNDRELQAMRKAGIISAKALKLAGEAVHPGVTTGHIDKLIYDYIVSEGARPSFLGYGDFPGSACISINDEVIHGIPGGRLIQEGDIVSVDVGAFYEGFHGDNAATFPAGEVSEDAQKLMDATRESLNEAIKVAQPGARLGDVSNAVQSYVEARGYSVVKEFVGHGVGRNLHEDPQVPNYGPKGRGVRLMPGMVIAIEPMVNQFSDAVKVLGDGWTTVTKDGGLAAHFEHTIAITKTGNVILTAL